MRRIRPYLPALVAAALLVPHALYFDFVNDDAYISFRYAKNLAEHGQLVFNLGERVEGYTNFLWTVLLALFMKIGVAPDLSSRVLGVAFAIGTLFVVNRASLALDGGAARPGHAIAPIGLAATSAFACWCMGGLETQLFTFLVTAGLTRSLVETEDRRGYGSAVLFGLAALTRPEGALLAALCGLFRLGTNLANRDARGLERLLPRRDLAWGAAFLGILVPYVAWRFWYYGWPFPNTYYVKSSSTGAALTYGLYYLRRFAEDHTLPFLAALALAGVPFLEGRARRRLAALAALVWVVFLAYTAKVGGDFMGLYRFVLPIVPIGALALQESLRALARRLLPVVGRPAVALAAVGMAAGYGMAMRHVSKTARTTIGADHGIDTPGYLKDYADRRKPVGQWFARHARPDDLMTVGGAGVIPYYAGIPAYDVFGLVDERIAHDPTMTRDSRPGHQKWGTDAYMVSRKPTLITHIYRMNERFEGPDPYWESLGYEWVAAEIPGLPPPSWYSFLKRKDRAFGPFPARAP